MICEDRILKVDRATVSMEGGRHVHIQLSQKSVPSFKFRRATRPTFLLRSNQADAENISGATAC
jgi:hypothetical protein